MQRIAPLRANDNEGLEDEWADLDMDWNFTSYVAKLKINKNKNRFVNIIPCTSTLIPRLWEGQKRHGNLYIKEGSFWGA